MENFKWQHIQFADGSNPYICTAEKSFKQMQKHYTLEKIKDGFWLAKANEIHGKLEENIMKKQKIVVTWEMCGYIEVDADSTEEAMNKVMENTDNFSLPLSQDYVDGSFWVSTEDADEMKAMMLYNKT